MRCASIHTFGMAAPLGVVALDGSGVVVATRVIRPGRVFLRRGTAWILETPSADLPVVGEPAEVRPILAGWPAR